MKYGVIDIGTNTIRGVAYQTDEKKMIKIEDKLVRSHILGETVGNVLSENGINRLIVILNKLVYILRDAGCKTIECFSTSVLRGLKNLKEIEKIVLETAGIQIDILNGEEEAKYDFIALRANVPEHSAIGLDLGGGSCQIVQFEYDRILFSESYDIGSNRLKSRYVSKKFPSSEERKRIAFAVQNELLAIKNTFGSRYIYAMGGTAKDALKLYNFLSNTVLEDAFLSMDKLNKLCCIGDSNPEVMYNLCTRVIKNQPEITISGIVILHTICDLLDVDGIYVLQCGIRDGYIKQMIEKHENFSN